ncbi:hypothetical protein HaLaN_27257 [Haematococcus lacustris]|uniref:Uncharacterized protein n=1 Tax=Haematococcus lacustris TaxID=44745 RepID=A0A6A0A853_HAELA|nr:hypothetical protein HaLaN_27257 [Haematococcus lacustris]
MLERAVDATLQEALAQCVFGNDAQDTGIPVEDSGVR